MCPEGGGVEVRNVSVLGRGGRRGEECVRGWGWGVRNVSEGGVG